MYEIDYSKLQSADRKEFFKNVLKIQEFTKEQYFSENIGLRGWKLEHDRLKKPSNDTYSILKQEVENLLEVYDLEEMMKSIDAFDVGFGNPENKKFLDKNGQFWELVYWRVFHDDPDFRPELIRHKIDSLEQIGFGFREDTQAHSSTSNSWQR